RLQDGDSITIGASTLHFDLAPITPPVPAVGYDDDPLGHTQLLVSTSDVIRAALQAKPGPGSPPEELGTLRRKADILALLYEMSTALSSVFNLDDIFEKAVDILLRVTPADRVLVLLTQGADGPGEMPELKVAKMRVRTPALEAKATHTTIGRTVTRKVIRER